MEYKKLVRKYRRIFRKHAREIRPYDYRFGLDPFLDFLRYMRDYYEAGDNVHSEEGDRLQTLKDAISMFEFYDAIDDEDLSAFKLKKQKAWEAFWRIVQENIRDWWD